MQTIPVSGKNKLIEAGNKLFFCETHVEPTNSGQNKQIASLKSLPKCTLDVILYNVTY